MRRSGAEQIPSILLATLSASFGVCLLEATSVFGQVISANSVTGSSSTLVMMLQIVASVFIVIAVYVGSIVTANTFATIIAGRTRTIALYRLIGAIVADQRRSIAREGLAVGLVGSVLGAVIGTAVTVGFIGRSIVTGPVSQHANRFVEPMIGLPIVMVVLTTWLAPRIGSRRVLQLSPVQATKGARRSGREVPRRGSRRSWT
jgi:putative ABC transport system permease protein